MAYKYAYGYEEEKQTYQKPKLPTNRSMWKFMLLTILTLGIYSVVFFIPFSFDIDKIDPKRDGSKAMNYLWAYLLSIFTFAIAMWVWHYQMAERIEEALSKRDVDYDFGTEHFWGWLVIGSLFLVGEFVYFHKLCKAMNLLCESYNEATVKSNPSTK